MHVSTGIMLLTRVLCTRKLQILHGTGDVLVLVGTYVHACAMVMFMYVNYVCNHTHNTYTLCLR